MFLFIQRLFFTLRIRNQILLLYFSILLLILTMSAVLSYITVTFFVSIQLASFDYALIESDKDVILNSAFFLTRYMKQKHQNVFQQLQAITSFYELYQLQVNNITITTQLESCCTVAQLTKYQIYKNIPRFCYGVNNATDLISIPKNDYNSLILNNAISFMNAYNYLIDNNQTYRLQVASISNSLYFSQFPFAVLTSTYNVQKRPWFINHKNQVLNNKINQTHNNFIFTTMDSYQIQGQLELAVTQSIYNNSNNFIGIAKQSLIVSNTLFPTLPLNILLIDSFGQIIYCNNISMLSNATTKIYPQNQTITGFNDSDWQQMYQYSQNSTQDVLVLINKLFNQKVNVFASQLQKENYTLVIYSNITNNLIADQKFDNLIVNAIFNFTLYILCSFGIFLLIILGTIIVISLIVKPLSNIKNTIDILAQNMGQNFKQEIYKMEISMKKDQLSKLSNSFLSISRKLTNSQSKKSRVCQEIESINFPKKYGELIRTEKHKQLINRLTYKKEKAKYMLQTAIYFFRTQPQLQNNIIL